MNTTLNIKDTRNPNASTVLSNSLLSKKNLTVRDLLFIGNRQKNKALRDLRLTDGLLQKIVHIV